MFVQVWVAFSSRQEYIRSNLWSLRAKTSAIAVELLTAQRARATFGAGGRGERIHLFFGQTLAKIPLEDLVCKG